MKRNEIFEGLEKIDDPAKDFVKILTNLHYTHFFLMDRYKKVLSSYDLSSPQSNVLGIIGHFSSKPLALEEIKEMVLEPNADVSRIVTRLADKGFVEKVVNPLNRRKVSIMITPKGMKTHNKLLDEKKFQKFTADITRAEARTFAKVLSKLRNS